MKAALQRMCARGAKTSDSSRCATCVADDTRLARKAKKAAAPGLAPPIVHEVLVSPGQPLEPATRVAMEGRFGHDFSRVRIHTDATAARSADAVAAEAWTVGRDIAFAAQRYTPGTDAGDRLLAHELAHVVQQRGAAAPTSVGLSSQHDSRLEQEAAGAELSFRGRQPSLSRAGGASLQRQSGAAATPGSAEYIEDYEQMVTRLATPEERATAAPSSDPVDGEFWFEPPGLRAGAKPIFDDTDTGVIIGFRYSSGGYYEIYDLQGTMIESGEPGLEAPFIDPIDILAGGLTGLGRGLIGGIGRTTVRGAGRGVAGAGVVVAAGARLASTLGRSASTALRAAYRALRFRGALNFTGTTVARMADPARRVPQHILKLAIQHGRRAADPQGVPGAFMYTIGMFRNGRAYRLDVILREADQTVLHFLYR